MLIIGAKQAHVSDEYLKWLESFPTLSSAVLMEHSTLIWLLSMYIYFACGLPIYAALYIYQAIIKPERGGLIRWILTFPAYLFIRIVMFAPHIYRQSYYRFKSYN
jgi:hypothetical protein